MVKLFSFFAVLFIFSVGYLGSYYHSDDALKERTPASVSVMRLQDGESCQFSFECESYSCQRNVCLPGYGALGHKCRNDYDCESRNCRAGRCMVNFRRNPVPKALPGWYCLTNAECASGKCLPHLRTCLGSERIPTPIGKYCILSSECASKNCARSMSMCLGSSELPGKFNEPCLTDFNCEQDLRCDTQINRCR